LTNGQPGDCKSSSLPDCYPCTSYSTEDCAQKCDKSDACLSYSFSTADHACRLYKHEAVNVWFTDAMTCCKRFTGAIG
jgi:hypothetical protein